MIFLPLYSYTIWRNPHTFWQNPIQLAETTDFCRKVYFCQIVSIAMLSAVSKKHARLSSRCRLYFSVCARLIIRTKREVHPSLVNLSKPKITNKKRSFLFFQAILLYFAKLFQYLAMPTSIPLRFMSVAGFALCIHQAKCFGEQAPRRLYPSVRCSCRSSFVLLQILFYPLPFLPLPK